MSEQVTPAEAMDTLIDSTMVVDYVVGSGLAQASIYINGQWFEVQVMPRTREEIIETFGQAD